MDGRDIVRRLEKTASEVKGRPKTNERTEIMDELEAFIPFCILSDRAPAGDLVKIKQTVGLLKAALQ